MWEGAFIDDVFLWGHPVPHLSWLWLTLVSLLFFPPLFIMPLLPLPPIFYRSSLFLQTFPNIHLPLAPGSFRSFAKMFSFIIHLWTQVLVKRGRKETKKRDMSYFLKFRLLKLRLGAKKKITIKIILQYFKKFLKRVFFHSFVSLTLQEFSILCSLPVFRLPWWLRWLSICLQCGRPGFYPWVGNILWRRKWQPTWVLMPGKSHGQRSLVAYIPRGHKELDIT